MNKKILGIFGVASLVLSVFVFRPPFVKAAALPCVKIEPTSEWYFGFWEPPVGTHFTVDCSIYNVTDLYGVEIQIGWDTEWIQYVNHTKKIPVETYNDGVLHFPTTNMKNDVDETASMPLSEPGTMYWLAEDSMEPAAPFSGSGTVFTMEFMIVNALPMGVPNYDTFINFTLSVLSGPNGDPIPHETYPGKITITAPIPQLISLPKLCADPHEVFGEYGKLLNLDIMLRGEFDEISTGFDEWLDVQGFNVTLNFNATQLQALTVDIDPAGWFASFWPNGISIAANVIDNYAGTVHFDFKGLPGDDGAHTLVNGRGVLAEVTFIATCEPNRSNLTLTPTGVYGFSHPERPMRPWNGKPNLVLLPHRIANGLYSPHASPDVNGDGVVDILDVVALTSVYGSKEGDPNWNSQLDLAAPYGAIDILDLVIVTSHYGYRRIH